MTMRKLIHLIIYRGLSVSLSKNAQQIDKQVDEIEVECQGSKQGNFLCPLTSIRSLQKHLFDLLRVVCCQSDKDQHAYIAKNKIKHRALDEDIDDSGYN